MYSLEELFGKQVRVTVAASYCAGEDKLKHLEIKCKRGIIWPYSPLSVGVETTHRIGAKILAVLKDKARVYRTTAEGIDIEIPVALAPVVFKYLKPKKRRQLSPEVKQALIERMATWKRPSKS